MLKKLALEKTYKILDFCEKLLWQAGYRSQNTSEACLLVFRGLSLDASPDQPIRAQSQSGMAHPDRLYIRRQPTALSFAFESHS